jgi:putative NADH-flavin reductase
MNKICVVGASGKLGKYMVQHALDRGCEAAPLFRLVALDDTVLEELRELIEPRRINCKLWHAGNS